MRLTCLALALACVAGTAAAQSDAVGAAAAAETEPNDKAATATLFDPAVTLRGELDTRDTDYFRFTLDDAGSRRDVAFELDTPIAVDLCLFDGDGERIRCTRSRHTVFNDLSLVGEYLVSISPMQTLDAPVGYRLGAGSTRPIEAGFEVEPNDRWIDALELDESGRIAGLISKGDKDTYAFRVRRADQLWQIDAVGDGVSNVELRTIGGIELQKRSGDGTLRLTNLRLPEGDYQVAVIASRATGAEPYTLTVASLGNAAQAAQSIAGDTADATMEAEPNDVDGQAQRLGFDALHLGTLGRGDTDMYRFYLPGHARVRIEATPASGGKLDINVGRQRAASAQPDQPAVFEGELLPGDHLLRVRARPAGTGYYRLHMTQVDALSADAPPLAGVAVAISGETPTLAAYADTGQRLNLGLNVSNDGTEDRDLEVVAHSTAHGWRPVTDQSRLALAAGERKRVAVTLDVLPDARGDGPVLLSLGVRDASGAVASATRRLAARCSAPLVNPRPTWPLPDALLGLTNAAWSGLGAAVVEELRTGEYGIDGIVARSTGAWMQRPGDYTVDLAGDTPLTLVGTAIHPVGSSKREIQLRDFELLVSTDGQNYSTVMQGTLTADPAEQAFVFEQPVTARYARLRLLSGYGGEGKAVGFGEWKVLVAETPEDILGAPVNIADNLLGGYDVYSNPFTGGNCCHETFSTAGADGQFRKSIDDYEWVMGFRDNRAAMIRELRWIESPSRYQAERDLKSAEVEVSMDSPVGPWEALATWDLARTEAGVAPLVLETPRWARFVRFRAPPAEGNWTAITPAQVQIIERASEDGYRSVLGEWGHASRAAYYEFSHPRTRAPVRSGPDAGERRETARVLEADREVRGSVLVGEDVDWYAVDVPAGRNELRWRLRGTPLIEYAWEALDAAGRPLEVEAFAVEDGVELVVEATPGRYYLRLYEPLRSIIFSWDTSGSVGPYYDVIDHTMKAFAGGVRSGREEVNLLPFNDGVLRFLLPDWSGDSGVVTAAVVNSDRKFGSSNAEAALLHATTELDKREGTRAVMFITDAESDGYALTGKLWDWLARVRPRVFSFEISSKGQATAQDIMQSFAAVNRGHYDAALSAGDLQIGFDRATCLIRRPKEYLVSAHFDQVEPKPPGGLLVRMDDAGASAGANTGDAVEVILDASGSMYRKLDDRFRYEIARDVLDDLVANVLPDGIGFALRAFGNREASSCRTDLEVALAPLDRSAARRVIAGIEPQPYAYTPIADSIARVASDIGSATGRKTVVLITDGEESCDGDVERAIGNLEAAGIEVQLNVIGFDFDADNRQAARETFRRWAALGGGSYYDAANASELADSLSKATRALLPYEVVDANGRVVAGGTVNGGEIELAAGRYTLRFDADSGRGPTEVQVRSAETTAVTLDAID